MFPVQPLLFFTGSHEFAKKNRQQNRTLNGIEKNLCFLFSVFFNPEATLLDTVTSGAIFMYMRRILRSLVGFVK